MVQYLVFDIETRVDKELVKEVYDPENNLTLDQAYDTARDRILEKSNQQSDFFPIPFHIPIAISTMQVDENYRILSLGCLGADRYTEEEMVARFWSIFESARTLVTFNGRGFDLPVLETRALKFALPLPRYSAPTRGGAPTGAAGTATPTTSTCAISCRISAPRTGAVRSTS